VLATFIHALVISRVPRQCETRVVRVTLLGPVSADAGDRQLRLGGRKQRAVFALLALSANRTVSLDRLVYEVWHDEPPARATLALQAYISRLRAVLAEASPDCHAQIVTRPPGWVLQIPAEDIDALRFETLLADARVLLAAGNAREASDLLREALGMWSGEPLAGLDEAGVAIEDVGRLQEQRLEASELHFEADLQTGEAAAIVSAARAFVTLHPYRERAWCALILALYRSGRQADALAATRELRQTLTEELGLDPSPEAQLLETRILQHDAALAWPVQPPREAPGPTTQAIWGVSQDPTAEAMVGRSAELNAVVAAVDSANDGSGRLLVLEGPAGMGKSTILRRLENSVRAVSGLVLRGGGVGAGAMPALWPWVTILRHLLSAAPDLRSGNGQDVGAGVLGLLDPSLGDGGQLARVDATLARTRLYRAVLDLLGTARETQALAVVLDDAQWIDAESLDLLALAVDELLPRGVLFAVALRPDESDEVRKAVAALGSTAPESIVRLPLTGLQEDSVSQIVSRISGLSPAPEVVEAVCARTGGNPFFVVELVRLLISERRLDATGVYTLLPEGVREVIRRRLDRLPGQTLATLSVVAVMARPVDVTVLADVTGMSEDRVLEGCEAAVLAGLLIDTLATGGFALCHDLVRQTLDESLSPARRARLHARIGQVLIGTGGDLTPEQVIEVAHHLTLGAQVAGAAAAVPYLLSAADDALIGLAPRQGEEYLQTAHRLAAQIPDASVRAQRQHEIRSRRVVTGGLVSSGSDSGGSWWERSTVPDPTPALPLDLDPLAPAAWWNETAEFFSSGNNASALAAAEQALRDDLPSSAAAVVYFVLGVACFELGLLDRAPAYFVRAEQLQREVPAGAARGMFSFAGTATVLHAAAATVSGEDEVAADLLLHAGQAMNLSPVQSAAIEYWTAWCAVQRGEPRTAATIAQRCHDRAVTLGSAFYELNSRILLGWASAVQGVRSGIEVMDTAYEEYRAIGILHQVTVHLILRAEAYAWHGNDDGARELVREAGEIARLTQEKMLAPRLTLLAKQLGADSAVLGTN
jgi:DNA-binding SARP family transcriptional activator